MRTAAGQRRAPLDPELRRPRPPWRSTTLGDGTKLFAGQRDDPFFVDLGSIFDLAGLRPFNALHAIPLAAEAGVDGVGGFNTNSIAIQVPLEMLTKDQRCRPARTTPTPSSACGPRRAAREPDVLNANGTVEHVRPVAAGLPPRQSADQRGDHPASQEGLLEHPVSPTSDSQFAKYYLAPEVTAVANVLYRRARHARHVGSRRSRRGPADRDQHPG